MGEVEDQKTGEPEGDAAVGAAAQEAGKDGRGGRRRKERGRAARITRRVAFAVLGFLLLAIAAFTVAYLLTPVPSPQEDAVAQGPEFYYSDGKTLIAKIGVNRQKVELDAVPEHVRDAVIAAENRSFYEDPGVSVRGTVRAFWSTVTGEQLQGGSTITQQMVRNYYQGLGQERTVSRKLKEIMVALKVDSQRDKDWILEQYLNTIFFGRDAYGIQAAAHAYYNKDVGELTKAEAAYLAAAIQQPTPFGDPTGENRAMAEGRWRSVVRAMVETGALGPDEAARMTFPAPVKQKVTDVLKGQTGYMVRIAQKELRERRGYTEDEINRSGLKITTTFDKRLMDAAEKAVKANLPEGTGKTTLTGLVSVDPETGQVVAFYGGRGYLEEQLSTSFGHWAQAGSGFKPIVLAAALDAGKTLNSTVNGASPQYYNDHPVENNGGTSYGYINLVTATQNSVNTAYVNLGQEIGLDKVTDMAVKMGIPEDQLTRNDANKVPTFPLGVASVRVVQQAGVYATFAAEGVYHTPYVVKSVKELDGDEHEYTEKGKRAFSEQVARDATYAMTKVVQGGTGTAAQLYDGRDVAGKTGTTDNGNALWFNGFIPQMATSVAIFRSDSPTKQVDIGGYSAYGGVLPAQIWRSYMTEAVNIKNLSPKSFGPPSTYASGGGGYDPTPGGGDSTGRPDGPGNGPDLSPPPGDDGPGTGDPEEPGGPPDEPEEPEEPDPPFEPPGGGGDGDGGGGGGFRGLGALPQQSGTSGTRRA
ncbi:transglycosylase domain-containing protein [Thermomonospora amylolytica]|uniref:transglycosylase domain-containing protein n=1 Tax=Thermomonospora amylolytica TaxID=1411117 RepID=UPI000E6D3CBD|nr:transglycosylase domain-containing protein [Thermomonospora amylolytica]